jgi:hypothetical protein
LPIETSATVNVSRFRTLWKNIVPPGEETVPRGLR